MAQFVVQLRFDVAETDRRMEVRPAHREYLAELKAAGKLVAAGPFTDQTGALLVYDVADEAGGSVTKRYLNQLSVGISLNQPLA